MHLLSGMNSSEAFRMGNCYAKRSKIISGPNPRVKQRQAQSVARHYLELSVALRNRDNQWALKPEPDMLQAELVLATVYQDEFGDEADVSLKRRIQTVHLAIRAYLDYFWTLMVYEVELPLPLVIGLVEILPNGFEGRFDLTWLKDPRSYKYMQKQLRLAQIQLKQETRPFLHKPEMMVEGHLQLIGGDEQLRIPLAEAVSGFERCVHEVVIFLTTLKLDAGFKQLCQTEESGRPRINLSQEKSRLAEIGRKRSKIEDLPDDSAGDTGDGD